MSTCARRAQVRRFMNSATRSKADQAKVDRYDTDAAYRADVQARNKAWRDHKKLDPEYVATQRTKAKARRAMDPEKANQYYRDYRARNPEKHRAIQRRANGIDNATGETRGGMCPICLKTRRKLVMDHDHITHKIRGWLCHPCNTFLGPTDDGRVNRAKQYLEKAKHDELQNLARP